jgi:putative ABC transport system ATP-binding protein
MQSILLDTVNKRFKMGENVVHALRDISLHIEEGEFVAIMGPSGSGKSTLMNILGCLDQPDSGRYFLQGQPVYGLSRDQLATVRNQKIGFVFQGFNLLARTSALENVELPLLYNHTASGWNTKKMAREALREVGLEDRMNHEPNQLSGGQQQRVAIARALVNRPAIIPADEPTGNLDTDTSISVLSLFQHLNTQGITIIFVTHEPDVAMYARRVIEMRDGTIRRDEMIPNHRNSRADLSNHDWLPGTAQQQQKDNDA